MESQKNNKPLRVFLWIVPRSNSTALTKCMSFVDDTEVWLEPYMACYMNETFYNPEWGVDLPGMIKLRAFTEGLMGSEEFLEFKKQEAEKVSKYDNVWLQDQFRYPWIKEQLEIDPSGKKFVFIKDQACAINNHLEYLPNVPARHAFLIRHPQEVYPSFKNLRVNYHDSVKVSWDEIHLGEDMPQFPSKEMYQIEYNLWKHVKENLDPKAIIIDGFDLTSKPEIILPKFFKELGIPYRESYLRWESDPELVYSSWKGSSDVVFTSSKTATFSRAVECSQFDPPKRPRGTCNPAWKMTDELKEYASYSMPFYEEMYVKRLT